MSYGLGPPEFLDWYELERLLQISRTVIRRRLIDTGFLPCYIFPGGDIRVKRSDVDIMLENCRVVVAEGFTLEDYIMYSRIESRFKNLRRDIQNLDESLKRRLGKKEE